MKISRKTSLLFLIGSIFLFGCNDIYDLEKYKRPDWLSGKIYTQISTEPDLSYFKTCIDLCGYDSILDVTGFYTVFAPTNDAFEQWFTEHPEYGNALENIPPQDLENLVERHILQNGWSLKQLQSLDIYGWIDKDDPDNDKPRGYKRQTLQHDKNKTYYIKSNGSREQIVDSLQSDDYRKVYSKSRKYGSIFFSDYFRVNELQTDDYAFYFDRSFESGNVYYGKAKIVSEELFAENGFVYRIDRVTDPLLNAEQIMLQKNSQHSFETFRKLINQYSVFTANMEATNLQPEAKAGGLFDTLFNLNYPGLVFNQQEELTGPNTSITNYVVRYQNSILAPTDEAIQRLLDEVVTSASGYPHWTNFDNIPLEVKLLIINAHLTDKPVYRTNIEQGFKNGVKDIVTLDEEDIVYKYYGSNCSFLGLNKAIVPRAFSSITGPVYLRPGYSTFQYAMEYSKTLSALKEEGVNYSFFVLSDELFAQDSSLLLKWINVDQNRYIFNAFERSSKKEKSIDPNQLTKMILNQVGTKVPTGFANKEFIENLAGNFLVINNIDNTITGGLPNTWGYHGDSIFQYNPVQLEEDTDNGKTYDVKGWFNTPVATMYAWITAYPSFYNLIVKAGLFDNVFYSFPFLTEGETYTVFVPTDQALANYNTDTLSQEELQNFIKYHFVRGHKIWTDGSSPGGRYETLRVDESSTKFLTKYSTLNIETGADIIRILDGDGNLYFEINEQEGATNNMIAFDTDNVSTSEYDFIITSVIHEIDTVLVKQ